MEELDLRRIEFFIFQVFEYFLSYWSTLWSLFTHPRRVLDTLSALPTREGEGPPDSLPPKDPPSSEAQGTPPSPDATEHLGAGKRAKWSLLDEDPAAWKRSDTAKKARKDTRRRFGFDQRKDGHVEVCLPGIFGLFSILLLFGLEWEHRRGDRHKFKVAVEYFPDATDFSEFRMVDKASWEVLLDKELNLSLSLNVIETINRPNPGGKEADLDYSAVLLWNF